MAGRTRAANPIIYEHCDIPDPGMTLTEWGQILRSTRPKKRSWRNLKNKCKRLANLA